jgi:hypothetical protein
MAQKVTTEEREALVAHYVDDLKMSPTDAEFHVALDLGEIDGDTPNYDANGDLIPEP